MANFPVIITGIFSIIFAIIAGNYRITEYVYGFYPKVTTPYAVLSVPLLFFGIFMIAFGVVFFNPPHPDNEEYRSLKRQAITSLIVLIGGLFLLVIIAGFIALMLFSHK